MLSPQLEFSPWSVIDGFSITPLWLGLRLCSFNISPYKVFKSIICSYRSSHFLLPTSYFLLPTSYFILHTSYRLPSIPEHVPPFRRTASLHLPCYRSTRLPALCFPHRAPA